MKLNTLIILSGLFISGFAHAECPSNLSKHDTAKCQSLEKSGINYQKWIETKSAMSDETTISPITGKDVITVAPAAGEKATPDK